MSQTPAPAGGVTTVLPSGLPLPELLDEELLDEELLAALDASGEVIAPLLDAPELPDEPADVPLDETELLAAPLDVPLDDPEASEELGAVDPLPDDPVDVPEVLVALEPPEEPGPAGFSDPGEVPHPEATATEMSREPATAFRRVGRGNRLRRSIVISISKQQARRRGHDRTAKGPHGGRSTKPSIWLAEGERRGRANDGALARIASVVGESENWGGGGQDRATGLTG